MQRVSHWRTLGLLNRLITIVWIAQISLVLIFLYIARQVKEGETLKLDTKILELIHSLASDVMDKSMQFITQFGGLAFVATITLFFAVTLWRKQYLPGVYLLISGVVGSSVINLVLKSAFSRHRPDLWPKLVQEGSYSFPSGHAMASLALAACIVIIFWHSHWRRRVVFAAVAYVVCIGLSRVYLGVHYPTDIVAGWAASLFWVLLCNQIIKSKSTANLLS